LILESKEDAGEYGAGLDGAEEATDMANDGFDNMAVRLRGTGVFERPFLLSSITGRLKMVDGVRSYLILVRS